MPNFYVLRYLGFECEKLRTLLQVRMNFLRQFLSAHIVCGFQKLVFRTVLNCNAALHVLLRIHYAPFSSYRPCCLVEFLKKDGPGLHIMDCRNDGEYLTAQRLTQNTAHKKRGEIASAHFLYLVLPSECNHIPNISFLYKKYWSILCQHVSKTDQYISAKISFQSPKEIAYLKTGKRLQVGEIHKLALWLFPATMSIL
jgi:hypothetical protein